MRIKSILKIHTKNKKLSYKIINNVDEILKIKSKNFNADVSEIEREINRIVYGLYKLSDSEIGIIERN